MSEVGVESLFHNLNYWFCGRNTSGFSATAPRWEEIWKRSLDLTEEITPILENMKVITGSKIPLGERETSNYCFFSFGRLTSSFLCFINTFINHVELKWGFFTELLVILESCSNGVIMREVYLRQEAVGLGGKWFYGLWQDTQTHVVFGGAGSLADIAFYVKSIVLYSEMSE